MRSILTAAVALVVVAAAVSAPTASAAAPAHAADLDCADFDSQAAAQAYFLAHGGPASDPDRLDGDHDGIACESNPCPCGSSTIPTPTVPLPPAPVPVPPSPPAACAPGTVSGIAFSGLPASVRVGRSIDFSVEEVDDGSITASAYSIELRDVHGRALKHVTGRNATLLLTRGTGDVQVVATALEVPFDPSKPACIRTIETTVRAIDAVMFYRKCWGPTQRPRVIVIACADAGLQFRGLRWRHWGATVARATGTALINDCDPFCAAGSWHRLPVKVRLSGPRRCPQQGFYAYERIQWRIGGRLDFGYVSRTGGFRVRCAAYGY